MVATPQEFSIWSKMTGNPYPSTPEERMFLGPHVRRFVQNIGRQGGYPQQQESGLKRAVSAIGKTALAAGLLVGGAMAAHHYLKADGQGVEGVAVDDLGSTAHRNANDVADNLENIHKSAEDIIQGKGVAHPFHEPKQPRLHGTVLTNLPLLQPAQGPESPEGSTSIGTPPETIQQYENGQDALVGHAPASTVEAFRRSKQYEQMRQENPALRGEYPVIGGATPGIEYGTRTVPEGVRALQAAKGAPPGSELHETLRTKPVTETARLATAQVPGPHAVPQGVSQREIQELDRQLAMTHGATHSVPQRQALRNQMLAEKLNTPISGSTVGLAETASSVPVSPQAKTISQAKSSLLRKAGQQRMVSASRTVPGTEEHLIAQAMEHLEGRHTPGAMSQNIPGSSIKNITLYPNNNVSVTWLADPETEYPYKAHPAYASALKDMLEQRHFMPGGLHSAGGFIQAGINKGLLA